MMKIYFCLCILFFLTSNFAAAYDEDRARYLSRIGDAFDQEGEVESGDKQISEIEGVYKRTNKFDGEPISDGKPYTQEDVLELVRIAKNAIYVRTRLRFGNGDFCSFYGVGRYNKLGTFSLLQGIGEYTPLADCKVEIRHDLTKDKVILTSANCGNRWCGASGLLAQDFPKASKRMIKYMERLKSSPEYKKSLEGWNKLPAKKVVQKQ